MACTDDDEKPPHDFLDFLESTFTKSSETAIHNVRRRLDSLVYVGGTDWEKQMNKFDALIAQLAAQNVYLGEKVKQSMLVRFLPESVSFLWTVARAQPDVTVEILEALIGAELNRKKNSNNLEGLNHNTSIFPKANQAKNQQENIQKFNRHGNK